MRGRTVKVGELVFCHPDGHPEQIKIFKVVEHGGCEGCYFRRFFGGCKKQKGLFGECKADWRTDEKNVIFKKINQVRMIKPGV